MCENVSLADTNIVANNGRYAKKLKYETDEFLTGQVESSMVDNKGCVFLIVRWNNGNACEMRYCSSLVLA